MKLTNILYNRWIGVYYTWNKSVNPHGLNELTPVRVMRRDGKHKIGLAGQFSYKQTLNKTDIVAYQILEPNTEIKIKRKKK